jgi:alanyl aminopeptidase
VAYPGTVRLAVVFGLVLAACAGDGRARTPGPGSGSGSGTGTAGSAAAPERATDAGALDAPGLRLPAGVAPRGYTLTLDVDPAIDAFHGEVAIELDLAEPRDHVWLHAVDLDLGAITVELPTGARPGMIAPGAGDEMVAIDLGGTVPAGPLTLRIAYGGHYHDDETVGLFRRGEPDARIIYSQLEAVQARKVLPCLDEPQFKVPWRITVRAPRGMLAVSNAPVAELVERGDRAEFRFAPTQPLPSYLVAIAVGKLTALDLGPVGAKRVPLRVIAPAGARAADAAWVKQVTPTMVERLEAYFGTSLPLAKLDLVAVADFPGAMENPGLITYDADMIFPGRSARDRNLYVEVGAHELAHMWFGDLVTLAWWDDLWLNESFATWVADKVVGGLAPGRDEAHALHGETMTALSADADPEAAALRRAIHSNADIEDSFDAIAYEKGAAVIAMFEAWIGPERFQQAIRAYLAAHADGVSDSSQFLDAIERVSDAGVRAAFASFVDQPGVPVIAIERRCTAGRAAIGLTQSRLVPVGTATPVTTWRVPVCVRFPTTGKRTAEGCVLVGGATAEIDLGTAPCPAWVLGNAGDRGYYLAAAEHALVPPMAALTPRERLGLVGGMEALIDAGRLEPATITTVVPALIATGEARDEHAAIELVRATRTLVAPARLPAWRAWARRLVAPVLARARAADKLTGAGLRRERDQNRLVFAAFELDDAAVIGAVRARAERWIDGTLALHGDELSLVLSIAVRGADRAFVDRLLAKASTLTDTAERMPAIAALGGVDDPAAARAVLSAIGGAGAADGGELRMLLDQLGRGAATRAVVLELYADPARRARLLVALGRHAAEDLLEPLGAACDAAEKPQLVAAVTPIAADLPGGQAALGRMIAAIDRCIARRAALGAALDRELGPDP